MEMPYEKIFLALACLAAGLSAASAQAKKHYGGFVGPETQYSPTTVAEVKNLSDDARVMLLFWIAMIPNLFLVCKNWKKADWDWG